MAYRRFKKKRYSRPRYQKKRRPTDEDWNMLARLQYEERTKPYDAVRSDSIRYMLDTIDFK